MSPSAPREQAGLYWGYTTRLAAGISGVLDGCPFKKSGYDLKVGTSEHGQRVPAASLELPKFKHLLVAFGGAGGLEESIKADKSRADALPTQVRPAGGNNMAFITGITFVR